jgi:hypothetical protein
LLKSSNGWTAYETTSHFERFDAADRGWWAANKDVEVIASYVITRWDAEVESVTEQDRVMDDWSYALRPVRGQTTGYSNHGSATAWDVNATQHPRGRSVLATFSPAQAKKVREIVNSVTDNAGKPVLRWGGDYVHSPTDGMHFEINAGAAQVKQAADKLRNKEKESDVEWTDKIKLTAIDAQIWGGDYKAGDEVTVGLMLRYPTLARRIEHENAAAFAALNKKLDTQAEQIASLVSAVNRLSVK